MANLKGGVVALAVVFAFVAVTGYVVFDAALNPIDPLAEFRNPEGGMTIPGGAFTPELQRLMFPLPALETYWTYEAERRGYATLNILGTEHDIPDALPYLRQSQSMDAWGRLFDRIAAQFDLDDLGRIGEAVGGALRHALSFDWLIGHALAVNRFAVFNDAQCTATTVSTDADCWSTTTGGNGDGAPVSGDSLILDTGVSPFTATGTMDANLSLGAQTVTLCSAAATPIAACGGNFTGTFAISTFSLTFTGTFTMVDSGGTISISTGTINGGTATLTSAADLSVTGAATLTFDSMTLTAGTLAKGTATLTLDTAGLLMDGGDLTSTSGAVIVTTNVNISSAASAIDFGSEAWTVSGTWSNESTDGTVWEAGSGTVTFDSSSGVTMIFAGANLAEAEFNNATFSSSAGIDQTFTMATRGLRVGGTLAISDASAQTTLDTSGSNLSVQAGILTLDGSLEVLVANGSTITLDSAGGSSDISGSFVRGSSTIVIAANHTLTTGDIASGAGETTIEGVENLTVNASVTLTVPGTCIDVDEVITVNGTLGGSIGCIRLYLDSGDTANPLALGGSASISAISDIQYRIDDTFTADQSWTVPGATYPILLFYESGGATVAPRTLTFNFGGAITSTDFRVNNDDGQNNVTIILNTTSLNSYDLTVNGPLRIGLTGQIGGLVVNASTPTVTGATTINDPGYIDLGSSTWTVSGSWTNATTSASWVAGTGTVTFDSATGGTMTFAGANLAEDEFNNMTFASSAAGVQTFTVSTRAPRWGGTLTVNSTSNISTSGTMTWTGGNLTLGGDATINGFETLNSVNTVNVATVTISDPSYIAFGSGPWTVSGTWTNDTTNGGWASGSANITFTSATGGTMTFAGTNLAEDEFAGVTTFNSSGVASQTFTLATRGLRANAITITGDTVLAKGANPLTLNTNNVAGTLTIGGTGSNSLTSTSGAVIVTVNVSIIAAGDFIDLGSETWTVSGTWTNSTTSASWDAGTGTVTFNSTTDATFTFAGTNLSEDEFSGVTFSTGGAGATTYTMATRGLRWGGTMTITDTAGGLTLAKATFTLTGGALDIGDPSSSQSLLTSTSGAVTVTNVTIRATGAIDFGSEAWTVSGSWTSTMANFASVWDAGTGTITFSSSTAQTMDWSGMTTEPEFNSVTFNSSASTAITFTSATDALRWGATLTITDTSSTTTLAMAALNLVGDTSSTIDMTDADGRLTFTTGDIVDVSDLNISGGQMTMDGISGITDIRIQAAGSDDFDVTGWSVYSIVGGLPDIRWVMDPDVAGTNVTVTAEGLAALTILSIYRDGVDIQQAGTDVGGTVVFSGGLLNTGWSSHTMIINLPGLTFATGGGGGAVPAARLSWTWRHLSDDLTVQFSVTSPLAIWTYEWFVGDQKIGDGRTLEYTFGRSGTYTVTLKATHTLGRVINTVNDVVAKSISFVGRYMPVFLLLVLAVWYAILLASDVFKSDASRYVSLGISLSAFGAAYWLLGLPYRTITMDGVDAILLYVGLALISSAGVMRSRVAGFILFGAGAAMLFIIYQMLIPFL